MTTTDPLVRQQEGLAQLYETTILDRAAQRSVRFVVVPARAFEEWDLLADVGAMSSALDLELHLRLPTAFLLAPLVGAVLAAEASPAEEAMATVKSAFEMMRRQPGRSSFDIDGSLLRFSERVTFEKFVPFERSPLQLESLAGLVSQGSGIGMGAAAGLVAFWGNPMVLVAVPFGMIIGGAAKGVGLALGRGLYQKTLRLMGADSPPPDDDEITMTEFKE